MPFNGRIKSDPDLNDIIPSDPKVPYDVRNIITRVVDHQDFLEIQPGFAPNIVIGFGRLEGRSIGVVANQPNSMAGVLDIDASDKAARFVRFCNAFNIPLVTLSTFPDSCLASNRSTEASSATARRCSLRTPRLRCQS